MQIMMTGSRFMMKYPIVIGLDPSASSYDPFNLPPPPTFIEAFGFEPANPYAAGFGTQVCIALVY